MVKRLFTAGLIIVFCSQGVSSVAYADSAEVLPKGVKSFSSYGTFYLPAGKRFSGDGGKKGNIEDIATDFNGIIDSQVFPLLTNVEAFFATFAGGAFAITPAGSGNIGNFFVDFDITDRLLDFDFKYGVTDKLTVGIHVPYWWSRNKVKAFNDPAIANIGVSAGGANVGAPLASLSAAGSPTPFGDVVPATTEDIKQVLGGGLDVQGSNPGIDIVGFGFKRFKSWSGEGIGDIEAGFRYQYLKTEKWRLATTIGARFPTAEKDDPDNLVDMPFGKGAYAVLVHLNNDYTGIKNTVINGTIRYDYILPEHNRELRIQRAVDAPVAIDKERVHRKYGDIVQLETSIKHSPLKGLDASFLYNFGFKYKNDRISGDQGFAYESLERETAMKSHVLKANLTYSTLPLYIEKEFPIPIDFYVEYRHRFYGTNNAWKNRYIRFGLDIYF